MPKSRRDKVIALTQTKKKDREWKGGLIEQIREALEQYQSVFVFRCANLRNNAFKELKATLADSSRFFMGSNKVMQVALGKRPEDEPVDNSHLLSEYLRGQVCLLLSNKGKDAIEKRFREIEVFAVAPHLDDLDARGLEGHPPQRRAVSGGPGPARRQAKAGDFDSTPLVEAERRHCQTGFWWKKG